MTHTPIPHQSLILVCDGARALLFENAGDNQALDLVQVGIQVEPHPPTRDLGTDRPTRVYESGNASRSAAGEVDLHMRAEDAFLARVALRLEEQVKARRSRHVIIVAPPRALGVLRPQLRAATREALAAEFDKDLAGRTTSEIERHLAKLAGLS